MHGGEAAATSYTLIEPCKAVDVHLLAVLKIRGNLAIVTVEDGCQLPPESGVRRRATSCEWSALYVAGEARRGIPSA